MTCSQDKEFKVNKNNNEHGCHNCVMNRKEKSKVTENGSFEEIRKQAKKD